MTEDDALALLQLYTDWQSDPALTEDELTAVLAGSRTVDADGLAPSDEDYTATYDRQGVYRAAAEAWDVKAGRLAMRVSTTTEAGLKRERQQAREACEALARAYRNRLLGSVRVAPLYGDAALVAGSVVP